VSAAIVSGREHSKELAASKALEAVHHTLMRSQDVFSLVVIQELLDSVGPEFHNVSGAVRITDEIGLDTQFGIIISRIAP